jgi:predicted aminopeptidase
MLLMTAKRLTDYFRVYVTWMKLSMTRRRGIQGTILVGLVMVLSACASLDYYAQSISGQWELWQKQRPIDEVLADPRTPPALRQRLQSAIQMREFASRELHLPQNGSYRRYADIQRPFVVWNVFAAKPFSVQAKTWCFPFAGCVGYRGYFSETEARAYAAELTTQGLETYVGGVAAYSTLGWFEDPLLNTVMGRSPVRLAGLMFHELAHQQLYVPGDTAFNEGFATAVELEGVRRWLTAHGDAGLKAAYAVSRQRRTDFIQLVSRTRDALATLYDEDITPAQKREQRDIIRRQMRRSYAELKARWVGYEGYDAWFAGPLNNAQLASVAVYTDYVPAFQRLLAEKGGDMKAFYAACAELARQDKPERLASLGRLGRNINL